ncbi:MAG: hypothetical protein RIC36_18750, partial [Rhodospirillales bacterium]
RDFRGRIGSIADHSKSVRSYRDIENSFWSLNHILDKLGIPFMSLRPKASYHLFLDEGIEAIDQFSFNPQHPELFMDPIGIGDDNSFTISEGQTELLRTVAHHPAELAAMGREELSIQVYQELAKALVSGLYDVYGTVGPNQIRAIALLHPESFMAFRSVTMIMAIFEQSLLALFWTEKYNISFQQSEIGTELFDTHREKGHLIRIHHVLHEGDNASRMNLERHWQTGESRANGLTQERVIDRIALDVEARFGQAPYCWSANRFFMNHPPILLGNRMPVKCAGLNGFQNFDIVISLASVNPPPWVKNMVLEQISISEEELYELWKLSHTYQIIGRCSLRLRDANRPIDVVVISRNCADNIHRLFEGSQIVGQLTDLPCYSAMQRRRGPARNRGIHYTGADNTAWTRYRKANEGTAMTKEEWYAQIRNPADERLDV